MVLADISLKRPVFITVIIIALLVVGILCYTGLNINDMPQADFPYVTATVIQIGASPDQLESKVAKKIEEAVGQISGVKHIQSIIQDNVSTTVIEFVLDKSPDVAAQEVRDKISSVRGELPQDIKEPVIAKYDIGAHPIISLAVTGSLENLELSQLTEDVITKKLQTLKGVGAVNTFGSVEREIHIKLDKERLAAYGLTTAQVINSLKSDNIEAPGGKVANGDREISLKTNASIKQVKDFNDILVVVRNGTEIRVRDVAEVIDSIKEKENMSFYQGQPAICIDVLKQSGTNTVTVADEIKKEVAQIQKSLPKGVKVEMIRDNSVSIRDSVDEVMKTIVEGCILAVIIVFLFLREWESTLISAMSLPTSIITTFISMKLMNFSLNTMSLMALSLAVGLLIDDAIVVIENVVRHLHMGKAPLQAAKEATAEIGLAVLATTFAVVAVFLPVAMVSGIIGKYFIEFGITVAVSMLVSLLISFTLVPMMSAKLLKPGEKKGRTIVAKFLKGFNHLFDVIAEKYGKLVGVVLRYRLIVLVAAILLFIGSLKLIPLLGFAFLPDTDNGEINITAELDSGLTLEAAEKKAQEIERALRKHSDVRKILTTVKSNNISIFVVLTDKKERDKSSREIAVEVWEGLKRIPGAEISVSAVSMAAMGDKDVSFNIRGDNLADLQEVASKAKKLMSQDSHAIDVGIDYKAGKPETKLDVDRDRAADLGVNTALVADTLNTMFNGVVVGKFETEKDRYDVRVSVKDEQRQDLDSLKGIYVSGSNNQMVSLDQVTRKVFATTSSALKRYDKAKRISLSANVVGMSTGDFSNLYLKKLNSELQLPIGVTISTGGATEMMQEGFNNLVIALGMGVLFIFLVMAAQFESFIDPISIMFALPMAMIGAILGLLAAGSELSIMAMIGIIMLMGLVAKNAILLVDFAKQRRNEGVERNEAIKEAGVTRLRPILMTTFAMIFGMIPLAVASGSGAELRAPMAHAVIGGLITSTLLTLFVVPVIYTLLDDLKGLFTKQRKPVVIEIVE